MTPINQTIFDAGRGDCLRACIASILDLAITEVPNFIEQDDRGPSHPALQWLERRGLAAIRIDWTGRSGFTSQQFFQTVPSMDNVYCVVGGVSPRSTESAKRYHAVVGRASGYKIDIVHDPHPSRAGLIGNPLFAMWILRPLGT